MGSPVVAIVGLVLGYTFMLAGIKNLSIKAAFQGQAVPAATPATTTVASSPAPIPSTLVAPSPVPFGKGKVKAI